MEIEIRLKKILQEAKLDYFGVTQDMARDLGLHRHTIGKLYRSQATHPSLEVLGQVCGWLERKGVDAARLPHALFGFRPSGLWQAMSAPGTASFYTGLYQASDSRGRIWQWIAQHDALVLAKIMQFLSGSHEVAPHRPAINIEYVRIRLDMPGSDRQREEYKKDETHAKERFKAMRAARPHSTVLIGSQRVNHLVEPFVADLFACRPFRSRREHKIGVPIYLRYREDDRPTSSCFGGHTPPPDFHGKAEPGLYFMDAKGKWDGFPWIVHEQDSGVVIISREAGSSSFEMALFGYSGPGTEALGDLVLRSPNRFWPPSFNTGTRELGVFVCRFSLTHDDSPGRVARVYSSHADVIPIDREVLKRCFASKS